MSEAPLHFSSFEVLDGRRVGSLFSIVSEGAEQREFFIDNLLVQIHLIIEMILVDRPCAIEV